MIEAILKKQIAHFLAIVLIASCFLNIEKSYAVYDNERSPIGYSQSNHMCTTGDFKFNPLEENVDIDWQLDNPTCISWVATFGITMATTGYITDWLMCEATNPNGVARQRAQKAGKNVPDIPSLTPNVAYKLAYRAGFCSGLVSDVAFYAANLPASAAPYALAQKDAAMCCSSFLVYSGLVGAAIGGLAIIYAAAKDSYDNGRICGHDWNSWRQVDVNGDYDSALEKVRWRLGKYPGSYQYCIEDIFIGHEEGQSIKYNSCSFGPNGTQNSNDTNVKNKYFREYLYGGKEYEDHGSGACANPKSWNSEKRMRILGYDSGNQRYYMKGSGVASNYACQRFILEDRSDKDAIAAFDCCKNRSQETICIENASGFDGAAGHNGYDNQFCTPGSRCAVQGITFEPFFSHKAQNLICAKTYSVCPYNHMLGGGTETAVYKLDESGTPTPDIQNFCQYRKHCVKVPSLPYIRISDLTGAYISASCRNMKGDSQNVYGYNAELLPISTRNFSAPIVQCFKETVENVLLNRAGSTKCVDPDEQPSYGVCKSGYFYKRDQALLEGNSFFIKIQNFLAAAIKIVLTISISLLGAMILMGTSQINKKLLLMYILKIGLIIYFALGTGWQFGFVDGILGSSNYISDVMMKLDYAEGSDDNKKDGCQFPRFNYADPNPITKYNNPSYPPGREYLKIWDTLDCKLARAMGFGPELSVPNLIIMILAGFLTGGWGLIFLVATFVFAFFMISVVMRAIHIFLLSSVAIVLLIYVSPITITLSLFERTKGIFQGWVKQLLGMALQPVILFAYLGIYISLFDNIVIGKATFSGDGRSAEKMIVCNSESRNTSIYCIFRVADLKTYSGLEIIGIGLPVLVSMNQEKVNTIIKAAFIMFIFSSFVDKISTLAAQLVGGSELKSKAPSVMDMAKSAYGVASGIQKRANRAMLKYGGGAAKDYAKNVAARAYMALYRGTKNPSGESGGDAASSSGTGKGADVARTSGTGADSSKVSGGGSDASKTSGSGADNPKSAAMPASEGESKKFSDTVAPAKEGSSQQDKDNSSAGLY